MVLITLPDGSSRSYEKEVTGLEIASSIGPRLAKEAIVIRVNEDLWDLNRPITHDAKVEIITRQQPAALEILRHDVANLLAEAVKELYTEAQITIGPAIDNVFFYDT